MATHEELVSVPFHDGNYRFCLDRVTQDDGDGEPEYAFVWRGTRRTPNGLVPKPAYFDLALLGQTLRQAMVAGHLPAADAQAFFAALLGLERLGT